MNKIGFSNERYVKEQSKFISKRLAKFNKLYLEFGGKLFDDYHASRVLPGFEPDAKIRMLLKIKDKVEVVLVINANDVESGTIYVLRSKSARSEIAAIKDLYKIGFTVTSVESRIGNAKNEPTYLCADVEVVATWKVYNVKYSTFEALIHKLFAPVQLQVTVDGHRPKEWFIVPFHIIEEAINLIIARKPIMYDESLQQIILLD